MSESWVFVFLSPSSAIWFRCYCSWDPGQTCLSYHTGYYTAWDLDFPVSTTLTCDFTETNYTNQQRATSIFSLECIYPTISFVLKRIPRTTGCVQFTINLGSWCYVFIFILQTWAAEFRGWESTLGDTVVSWLNQVKYLMKDLC